MIRFPFDLRADLMKFGFQFSRWETMATKLTAAPDSPEILHYKFASVSGILCVSVSRVLTIIAIANEEPGNGRFALCMSALEQTAKEHRCPLQVAAIWNKRLKTHLVSKRGYSPHPENPDTVTKL